MAKVTMPRFRDMILPASNPSHKAVRTAFLLTCLAGLILALTMPVFHQEAYYFLYSRNPALSYYDHPPMSAWLIWLSTSIFGSTPLGVRFMTWVLACGITQIGITILRDREKSTWIQYLWVLLSLASPLLAAGHFHSGPDTPLVFFWMLALWALLKARENQQWRWWLIAAFGAGCALLSKYIAAFLGLGGIIVLLFDPAMRRQLKTLKPWVALVLAVGIFSPVIIWNAEHDWASFAFQTQSRFEDNSLQFKWLAELVGLQILVLNPLVAIFIPIALWWAWRQYRKGDMWGLWLLAFGTPMVFVFGLASLTTHVKVNWLMATYPALIFAFLCWVDDHKQLARHPRVARFSFYWLAVSLALAVIAPLFDVVPLSSHSKWVGWNTIAKEAEACEEWLDLRRGDEGTVFFFSSHYSNAAFLGYNLIAFLEDTAPSHDLEPVLARNVLGQDALEFDYWTSPQELVGFDAVFVLPDPEKHRKELKKIEARFSAIKHWKSVTIERFGIPVHTAAIYACFEYRGPTPEQ